MILHYGVTQPTAVTVPKTNNQTDKQIVLIVRFNLGTVEEVGLTLDLLVRGLVSEVNVRKDIDPSSPPCPPPSRDDIGGVP